ncbi:MAG TPA: hypothetical protein VKB57_23750 [Acidimicrobiales bacterium]|nr:hypothetical protein [Acidimicrobiales bacterium]
MSATEVRPRWVTGGRGRRPSHAAAWTSVGVVIGVVLEALREWLL